MPGIAAASMTTASPAGSAVRPAPVNLFVAVLIIGLVAARLVWLAYAPIDDVSVYASDDAYYYFKTAQNIVAGHGVTFDGINRTNGFHPLWMGVILPIFAACPDDPDLPIRLVSVLSTLLAGGTLLMCWAYVSARAGRLAGAIALFILVNPVASRVFLNGLETGLLLFILFLLLLLDQRMRLLSVPMPFSRKALLGVLCAMLFLGRLDMAFIVAAIFAGVACLYLGRSPAWRSVVAAVAGCAPVLAIFLILTAPYILWNILSTGHIMPISGALKSTFPRPCTDFHRLVHPWWLASAVFIAGTVAWVAISHQSFKNRIVSFLKDHSQPRQVSLLAVLWIGCVMHFVYSVAFLNHLVQWWHFASYLPVAAVMVATACGDLMRRRGAGRATRWIVVCVLACAGVAGLVVEHLWRHGCREVWRDAAMWARNHTPENAVFAMTDAGYFGYFSGRATVNLDGVINGFEYQAALGAGRLPEYLADCGVTHIVDYEVPIDRRDNRRIKLPARLAGRPGYELRPSPAGEVYASEPYHQEGLRRWLKPPVRFTIWDYRMVQVRPLGN